jgi:predicted MPP superfamily phosphohydrolase
MKGSSIFIFLAVVLTIFSLLNYYLIRRGWQALAGTGGLRTAVLIVYGALTVCFFAGRALSRGRPGKFAESISVVGSFYMGILIYLFLLLVFVDGLRLIDKVVPFFPAVIRQHSRQAGRAAFFVVTGITLALTIGGFIHMRYFRVKTMDIVIGKRAGGIETLNLVLLGDIHVGPFMHNPRLEKIVQTINSLKPDLVLIPGDIVNEETLPSELEKMTASFRKIRSRYGVFASTGNHEYFAGIEKSLAYLRKSGFTVLQDEAVCVANSLTIVGRINSSYIGHTERRKPLNEILSGADLNLPVILLDHQPVHLEESQMAGVDLQLSGHTHGGAIFPITIINDRLYEIGRGYGRKGNTQYYVTSGVGIWEPPARIGTTAEIVLMRVKFRP